jgi:hypothetical protein
LEVDEAGDDGSIDTRDGRDMAVLIEEAGN